MSGVNVPSVAKLGKRLYQDFLCSTTPHDVVVSLWAWETWGAAKARDAVETNVARVRKEETIL
jgi:hypothetical protein